MVLRKVTRIVDAVETPEGAGAIVRRAFPTRFLSYIDPFVLLDEFSIKPPAGFPFHPHKGFEAVTYMLEGGFHHQDNLGNDSIVRAGGVQRFTAGTEIVHAELPGTEGINRGLQLWIKLPKRLAHLAPTYQQAEPSEIVEEESSAYRVRIILGKKSPVKIQNEAIYLDVNLFPKSTFTHTVDPNHSALLYALDGEVAISDSHISRGQAAVLNEGNEVRIITVEKSRFVLLTAKPHGEPILLRGSFVY